MKKALVISGGGSKGAFAGGVAQYLMEQEKREYDMFLGTSTGSLLAPHLAVNDIAKLAGYEVINNLLFIDLKYVPRVDWFNLNVRSLIQYESIR